MKQQILSSILFVFLSLSSIIAQNLLPTSHISAAGAVDTFNGGYTFSYATSGSPWNGALISFGGLSNRYDCQLNSDYGPHGGNHISFRTKNGDFDNGAGMWNSWNEIWHSANLNRNDVDFNAKNVYANGNIWAKEIKVALSNPWPDYVFDKNYSLPSLKEVEKYIRENNHLQNVPTAEVVKLKGLALGEMVKIQQEKIEELTLYLIQQSKEIETLQKENESFKKLSQRLSNIEEELKIKN